VPQLVVLRVVGECIEPKAHHLEIARVVEEAVLRLEVMVEHAVRVAKAHGGDELADVVALDARLPVPGSHDLAKKLPAMDESSAGQILA
jgi:hypothetical protein